MEHIRHSPPKTIVLASLRLLKGDQLHIRHSPHQNEGHSIIIPHLHNRNSYISPPPPIKSTTHSSPPHSIPCPRPTITHSPIFSNQYKHLNTIRKELQGLYVLPRENDVYTWDGVLFVTSGVWEEGIFKFTLHIPKEYISILPLISQ